MRSERRDLQLWSSRAPRLRTKRAMNMALHSDRHRCRNDASANRDSPHKPGCSSSPSDPVVAVFSVYGIHRYPGRQPGISVADSPIHECIVSALALKSGPFLLPPNGRSCQPFGQLEQALYRYRPCFSRCAAGPDVRALFARDRLRLNRIKRNSTVWGRRCAFLHPHFFRAPSLLLRGRKLPTAGWRAIPCPPHLPLCARQRDHPCPRTTEENASKKRWLDR